MQLQICYLGDDENTLSLVALRNMYELVAANLKKARGRLDPTLLVSPSKLKTEDTVLIASHAAGPFDPVCV